MKTNIRTLLITACVALLCVPCNAQHKITVNDGLKWAESLYGILGIGPSWGRSTSAIDTITLEKVDPTAAGFVQGGIGYRFRIETSKKYIDLHTELTAYVMPVNGDVKTFAVFQGGAEISIAPTITWLPMAGLSYSFGGADKACFKMSVSSKFIIDIGDTQMAIEPGYRDQNFFLDNH